jgi:hypothetical protein
MRVRNQSIKQCPKTKASNSAPKPKYQTVPKNQLTPGQRIRSKGCMLALKCTARRMKRLFPPHFFFTLGRSVCVLLPFLINSLSLSLSLSHCLLSSISQVELRHVTLTKISLFFEEIWHVTRLLRDTLETP